MKLETLGQKAKSYNWHSHDKTSFEGSTIESITNLDYIILQMNLDIY